MISKFSCQVILGVGIQFGIQIERRIRSVLGIAFALNGGMKFIFYNCLCKTEVNFMNN